MAEAVADAEAEAEVDAAVVVLKAGGGTTVVGTIGLLLPSQFPTRVNLKNSKLEPGLISVKVKSLK